MRVLLLAVLVHCACGSAAPDESQQIFSGPQPGEQVLPFAVHGVRGDHRGKLVDLVEKSAGGPLLIVFFHEKTRPGFALTNAVAGFAETRAENGLTSGIVYLTADATETENWLKTVDRHLPAQTFLGISRDGREGPRGWGLNRNVVVTVIVADEGKVTANFALRQPSVDIDGPRIFQAIADVTGGGKIPDVAEFSSARQVRERVGNTE